LVEQRLNILGFNPLTSVEQAAAVARLALGCNDLVSAIRPPTSFSTDCNLPVDIRQLVSRPRSSNLLQ